MEMLGFKVADVCECFLYFAEGKQFYTLYFKYSICIYLTIHMIMKPQKKLKRKLKC